MGDPDPDKKKGHKMRRAICFRGRNKEGKWFQGHFVNDDLGWAQIVEYLDNLKAVFNPVEEETVGQWTGLRDERGFRIYEGDVIKSAIPFVPNYDLMTQRIRVGVVKWDISTASFRGYPGDYQDESFELFSGEKLKVFGNIWDDPDLKKRFYDIYFTEPKREA